ncbi:MAG: AmmeMemoRadiSam system protein B [Candidatus Magasanikbacteria bacterium]|jgi:MEMO1 family protein|nr:AmmeMemoRadiSam system protein B [Candidatus Magasanikbacteria bacterium]MBT5262596.1 AmmeMemoRadiSam system protein B [Candidatus Magasanikbacteria bacterium]MBT5819919.1 AmmeMemoRadiSam system protein B [Candidatus Magasanikbacteria bacterium]MBT6294860.1 AmmeMemoRadiSam system protein B [Candidatus Magasanikbacteria bacterium]
MSLVFAAVTPHIPLLIPTIGKEQGSEKLAKTITGMRSLEEALYVAKPDIICIISPHEGLFDTAFIVNAHTSFTSSYEIFSDFTTKETWEGAPDLAAKISHSTNRITEIPLQLISEEKLTHGATVPLHYLTPQNTKTKVLPIGFSNLSTKQHIAFGEVLKDVFMLSKYSIAVIASGDLSHTLTHDAPNGYNEQGARLDTMLIDLLEANNTSGIIQIDPEIVSASHECGYRSLLVLLGIIKNMRVTFKTLSYEHPYGIGHLVGNFEL